jgi:hypothetical protein
MLETVLNQTIRQKDRSPANQGSVPLKAEEVEPVIAPKIAGNHNETVLAARLDAEEIEPVIAPKIAGNHNETVLS